MLKTQIIQGVLRVGVGLVLVYAVFMVLVFLGQRRMLYIPSKYPINTLLVQARTLGMEPWKSDAGDVIGWKHVAPTNGPRALVVHGNAGCALHRDYYVENLTSAGFKEVFVLEYPGYGARPGSPSQESLFAAADEALSILEKSGPVYVVGESLGTGVAAYLANRHPKAVAGLLLVTPYHNMTEVGQSHMPWLAVSLLLKDRFPSAEFLQGYQGPVAVLLAGEDTVIPNKFGRKLFDSYTGPKKLWLIPNAGHNDVFLQPVQWWRQVKEFWGQGSGK